jgi:hypothetical protein
MDGSPNDTAIIFRPSGHLRYIADSEGMVILDVKNGALTQLNSTGAYVWAGLLRAEPVSQIVTSLASETNTDIAIVQRDVDVFLDQIVSQHLVYP